MDPVARPDRWLSCSTSLSAINPCTQSAAAYTNRNKTTQFSVQNKSIEPVSYIMTCGSTAAVSTCSTPSSLYVPSKSTRNIVLTWTTTSTVGSGTATLTADDGSTPITGTVNATVTVPPPTLLYVAAVNPHLQRHPVDSGQADTVRFVVRNAGADSTGWSWSATCSGSSIVGGTCSPTSGTVGLAAGASSTVAVSYTTGGAANASGTVKLAFSRTADATIRDSGTVEVVTTRRDSLVQVSDQNPGESVAPDQCVTASVGPGLAAECGDLRAAHVLPSLHTLGTGRAPVLLYHSRQAHPRPIVRADVTLPDARVPDSVIATLLDSNNNAISGARGNWAGSQWRAHSSRRVAVQFDGISWPSGRHRYSFQVQRYYSGSLETSSATGRFWIVNRSASAYGAGWWIAGLEQVIYDAGHLRWVGGDGATRFYVRMADSVWVAAALDRPDSIVITPAGWWERRLRHGLRVRFDNNSGLHAQTINRLGQITRFVYVAGTSKLDSIVPPSGSRAVAFLFRYDGSNLLRAVEAAAGIPTGRTDSISSNSGTGNLESITLRDGSKIQFGYDGSETHRIITRTDRRLAQVGVSFATGGTIATVRLPRDTANAVYDTLRITAAETRGVAGTAAAPLAQATTVIDGLRTDVGDTTVFEVNRWGAPVRVRNALGDETMLTRGNGTFPALVTRTRGPTGQIVSATYDARGNVASITDSATFTSGPVYATTSYLWDQAWDVVTRVIGPEGDSTNRAYDGSNGNPLWAQDGRGSSTRTNFSYYTSGRAVGMVARSLTALGVWDSTAYDSTLGNPSAVLGRYGHYTHLFYDGAGRLVSTAVPYDSSGHERLDSASLDLMDRDVLHRTFAGGDTLFVRRKFGLGGTLDTITRRSSPDTNHVGAIASYFAYDGRSRVVTERLVGSFAWTYDYDPAGNLLYGGRQPANRRYDALNRAIWKGASDTSQYVFDEAGALRVAFNPVARVARTYYANGTLATDSLRIAAARLNERVFSSNVFGTGFRNDLAKRRVAFQHPQTIAPLPDSQRYVFSHTTGFLDSVVNIHGYKYSFTYDNDGRVRRLVRLATRSDSVVDTVGYDSLARRVVRRQVLASGTVLHNDTFRYAMDDKLIGNGTDAATYNPMGAVVTTFTNATGNTETYQLDALGNRRYSRMTLNLQGPSTYTYESNSERVSKVITLPPSGGPVSAETTFNSFSFNGALSNDLRRKHWSGSPGVVDTLQVKQIINTYDDERRLIQSWFYMDSQPIPRITYIAYHRSETYRYDPLGRRVWRQTIRDTANAICTQQDKSSGCRNEVSRTVWDGDQVLYDVMAPADTVGDNSEGYPSNGTFTGRVGYTHAGGIDTPLDLFKGTDIVLPYADWRGQYDVGTCPGTTCSASYYFPGNGSSSFGEPPPLTNGPASWHGELVTGMADGSGYQYKRNRYYNPTSGQFTQEDPIGLAGGLNTYGFTGGDPVNFSDPFGLCPEDAGGDGKSSSYEDCLKGTSGYYANQIARGENKALNTVLGWGAACGESIKCEVAAGALAVTGVGAVAGAGEYLGLNQYLRAGMRTFEGAREFRISGKLLDAIMREEGTHWTSAKVIKAISEWLK